MQFLILLPLICGLHAILLCNIIPKYFTLSVYQIKFSATRIAKLFSYTRVHGLNLINSVLSAISFKLLRRTNSRIRVTSRFIYAFKTKSYIQNIYNLPASWTQATTLNTTTTLNIQLHFNSSEKYHFLAIIIKLTSQHSSRTTSGR